MSNKNRRTSTAQSLEKYGFDPSKQKLTKGEKGTYTIKEGVDSSLIIGDGQFNRPNDGKPFTGWTWVPVKNRNTGVWSFIDNGIITDPFPLTTATDGTPFSRGGAGALENIFKVGKKAVGFIRDVEADRRLQQQELMADTIDYTQDVWNNRVSPVLTTIGDRLTPSAEDPRKSKSQVDRERHQETINAADEILLRWKGGQ